MKWNRLLQNWNLFKNVPCKDFINARIIKKFQPEVGALASKVIWPRFTILSFLVKLPLLRGKAKRRKKFLKKSFECYFWHIVLEFAGYDLKFWVWENSIIFGTPYWTCLDLSNSAMHFSSGILLPRTENQGKILGFVAVTQCSQK